MLAPDDVEADLDTILKDRLVAEQRRGRERRGRARGEGRGRRSAAAQARRRASVPQLLPARPPECPRLPGGRRRLPPLQQVVQEHESVRLLTRARLRRRGRPRGRGPSHDAPSNAAVPRTSPRRPPWATGPRSSPNSGCGWPPSTTWSSATSSSVIDGDRGRGAAGLRAPRGARARLRRRAAGHRHGRGASRRVHRAGGHGAARRPRDEEPLRAGRHRGPQDHRVARRL